MGAVGAIGSIRRGIQSVLDAKHTEFVFYVCMYVYLLAVYTTDSQCTKHPDFQAHDEYLGNHNYIQGTTIKWSDMMTGITHWEDLIMISHHPYQKFPKLSCTLISPFKLSFDTAASLIPTIKCNCMKCRCFDAYWCQMNGISCRDCMCSTSFSSVPYIWVKHPLYNNLLVPVGKSKLNDIIKEHSLLSI